MKKEVVLVENSESIDLLFRCRGVTNQARLRALDTRPPRFDGLRGPAAVVFRAPAAEG